MKNQQKQLVKASKRMENLVSLKKIKITYDL
jgi:hypothetical protein